MDTNASIVQSPTTILKFDYRDEKIGKLSEASKAMMTKLIRPSHTDSRGYVYGGQLLSWIDIVASIAARRHCDQSCVTRSVDGVHFLLPIKVGDVVVLKATVNRSWNTSMEVGVRVETEDPLTGDRQFCCHAYLTFVAVTKDKKLNADSSNCLNRPNPIRVPPILPKTDSEIRRYELAGIRRNWRLNSLSGHFESINLLRDKLLTLRAHDPLGEENKPNGMMATYGEVVELVLPQHANTLQITFGGQIMEWMEYCAVVCALRHSRSHLLTASVDTLQFHKPTYVGDVVSIRGVVTFAFKTSLEVYVTVSAENSETKEITFTNDGFFTVAAVDISNKPTTIQPMIPEGAIESGVQDLAFARRALRLKQRNNVKSYTSAHP